MFALGHEDDLVRLVARVEALQAFLKTDDGANLLAGYKRAANILKAEEKKDSKTYIGEVRRKASAEPAGESSVRRAGQGQSRHRTRAWQKKISPAPCGRWRPCAGRWMLFRRRQSECRRPKVRENRLHLLAALRATLHQVADFSKIEGVSA